MSIQVTPEQLEKFRKSKIAQYAMDDADMDRVMAGAEEDLDKLLKIADEDIASIPEIAFVQVFLPYFTGKGDNLYEVSLSNWLTVAGGPYYPVNVVDNTGTVLFQVPPIIDPATISPKEHEPQNALFELLTNANQLMSISPRQGLQFFRNHMTKQHETIVDKTISVEFIQRWNEIFIRYNHEPMVIPGLVDPKADSTPKTTDLDLDDVSYDPL